MELLSRYLDASPVNDVISLRVLLIIATRARYHQLMILPVAVLGGSTVALPAWRGMRYKNAAILHDTTSNMALADPTYPLLPIACFISSGMLLLVLLNSFIRQSWNVGLTFLCVWLFFNNITNGVSAIAWSDDADIKFYIYCDISEPCRCFASSVIDISDLQLRACKLLYLLSSPWQP